MNHRMILARRISLVALGLASAVPLACSGSKPAQTGGVGASGSLGFGDSPSASNAPPQGSNAPPPGSQTAPAASSGPPLAPTFTNDPNQLAQLFAAAAAAGAALLQNPSMMGGDPTEAGLRANAAKSAPGMQPEGQVAKGTLQEGGHLGFLVPMQAGKCYTIVGFSPSVQDLDLNLLAPPFYNMLAGQDGTSDNAPVIGRGTAAMCPVTPFPLSYKVDIFAKKGAGPVAVQVYSKSK